MKKLLLTSVAAAMVLASNASYANKDDMPRTRTEAIKHYQAKIDKLKGMTDQEYLDWKKTKASKKATGETGHSEQGFKSHTNDIGTDEASENTKHNATAK